MRLAFGCKMTLCVHRAGTARLTGTYTAQADAPATKSARGHRCSMIVVVTEQAETERNVLCCSSGSNC